MPHLSPLNWTIAITIFWFFLFTLSIRKWWSSAPKHSAKHITLVPKIKKWPWL